MRMSSNFYAVYWFVAEVSEDITNAVCMILKLSAWLDTTRIRVSSKKKKNLKFGWTDPKTFRLRCMKPLACKMSLSRIRDLQYGHCSGWGDTLPHGTLYSSTEYTRWVTAVWLSQGIDFNLYALFVLLAPGCCYYGRWREGNQWWRDQSAAQ